MDAVTIVWFVVAGALLFAIINGIHDAANSIATIVSTRVLSPRYAVLWAATFNFVALFVFHTGVAETIASIVEIESKDPAFVWVVMCGLLGAIAWNVLTWWWGLPSSSSHALIGALSGAGIAYAGTEVLDTAKLYPVLAFILVAPLAAMVLGMLVMIVVSWIFRRIRPRTVDSTFRIGQLLSAAAYSIGHGGNDAQTTIGVIVAVMIAGGQLATDANHELVQAIPQWVLVASYGCMALGTAIGGWRIVKTMGMRLTHLKPVGGFCAELAAAITLFFTTSYKMPVSTTHTITGAIVGAGSVKKLSGIRWGVAGRIVWAWIITIPMAGLLSAACVAGARAAGAF